MRFSRSPVFQKHFWDTCTDATLLRSAAARPGADRAECIARVKQNMNQRNNLAMIDAKVNMQVSLSQFIIIILSES